jgi:tRNA G10  N-methylase Trm11
MKYFFTLGNHPEISQAEIRTKLTGLKIDFEELAHSSSFLILETKKQLKPIELIKQLSGSIKIGVLLDQTNAFNTQELATYFETIDGKLNFGISTYNFGFDAKKTGLQIKKELKSQGQSCRYVDSRENPLSSVIVDKEILPKGTELVIMKYDAEYFIGKTIAVQPYNLFSKLDYGRPNRDEKSGMLPLKLAQTMINLSGAEKMDVICDPFCGSGTIIQQAMFLGYKHIFGFDKSKKAVRDTMANTTWFKEKYKFNASLDIRQMDTQTMSQNLKKNSVDAIITETYLGPPLKGYEKAEQMETQVWDLKKLYKSFFQNSLKILKDAGVIIVVLPEYKIQNYSYNFNIIKLLPKELVVDDHWVYSRENQKVIRHIYKLHKIA